MDKRVVIVGAPDNLLYNMFAMSVTRQGYELIPIEEMDLKQESNLPIAWIIYADKNVTIDETVLQQIDELHGRLPITVVCVGAKEKADQIAASFKNPPDKIFYQPFNMLRFFDYIASLSYCSIGEDASDSILVIDDDPTMPHFIKHLLEPAYDIYMATNGDDGITFLSGHSVSLILLDIRMPGKDGFETLKEIRTLPGYEDIPVIFLSGRNDLSAEVRGLSAGAADFIRKPITPEILRLRVSKTIELYKLQNSLAREVDKKTSELTDKNEKLSLMTMQVVEALSGAGVGALFTSTAAVGVGVG